MKILIACEFSGRVRDAFTAQGHYAVSCDLLPTESPGLHLQQDIFTKLGDWDVVDDFDMMIAFPPCTHLAVSGARWFETKKIEQRKAIWFFAALAYAPIEKICIENPISIMSTTWRKPDQIIQPWQFGHGETKATCLWLKNLPKLKSTNVVDGREQKVHKMPPSKNRGKLRSITYQGIADAMAKQWG